MIVIFTIFDNLIADEKLYFLGANYYAYKNNLMEILKEELEKILFFAFPQ